MSEQKKEFEINVLWLPAILVLGMLYIISRIDFIPDSFAFLGQMDDVIVALAITWFFTSWLPRNRRRVYWFKPHSASRADAAAGSKEAQAERKDIDDPFSVLNVSRTASKEEIKRAYREMIAKYHPDKVCHLGEEFQRLAHGKVIEITRAYEMLSGKE